MSNQREQLDVPRTGDLWVNPNTNAILNDKSEIANPSLRHYFGSDVEAALLAWETLNDDDAALSDVHRIIAEALFVENSNVHEVYFPDSKGYATIVLKRVPNRGSIFVASGYVDHYAQLPGSQLTQNGLLWRSLLPTSQQHATSKKLQPIRHVSCPHCYNPIPITGQCDDCDWLPNPYEE